MCGIAGVVVWDEKYRVTRDTLAKMSAAIAHRGPDGEGLFITRENEPITPDTPQVAFAFRRLAILDCDERAMQPMHTPDGRYTIVFNGEIYNFRELREELTKLLPNHAWRTTGDTEVLLMSYATWGDACVDKLNGMFAFAVWDHEQKRLFLARDPMGQKPLYEASDGDGRVLVFGSELSALQQSTWVQQPISTNLIEYLHWGYVDQPGHMQGVSQLLPGWQARVSTPQADTDGNVPYFSIKPGKAVSDDQAVHTTRRLIELAVKRQMVSDVPLGVFLSGGVDSSIIAACARRLGPVKSFSIGFDDPRYDESAYATAVAKHLRTQHHSFRVTPDTVDDLPKLAQIFGQPFADSSALPTYYLARETRRHVTVALSGDGGDELFGGYDRYRAMRLAARMRGTPASFQTAVRKVGQWLPGTHPKSRLTRLRRFTTDAHLPPAEQYSAIMRLFSNDWVRGLLLKPIDDSFDTIYADFADTQASNPLLDEIQTALAVDRTTYLPGDLLTKVDRCSMAHGLEVRSPFMDHELVHFAAGLTTDQLLKGGPKRMLREAFADDLPAWVFKRKKMGFAVPIGEWFRGPLRSMLRDHLFASDSFAKEHFQMKVVERLVEEHETQKVDHSQRLYALLMLELWWKQQPSRRM